MDSWTSHKKNMQLQPCITECIDLHSIRVNVERMSSCWAMLSFIASCQCFNEKRTAVSQAKTRWKNNVLHPRSLTARPWRMMVGRLLSFWDGLFSGAMLNFRWVKSSVGCDIWAQKAEAVVILPHLLRLTTHPRNRHFHGIFNWFPQPAAAPQPPQQNAKTQWTKKTTPQFPKFNIFYCNWMLLPKTL